MTMKLGVRAGPGPFIHPENQEFWTSIDKGMFRLQRCSDCGTIRFPVAPCCWRCLSTDYAWQDVDGDGRVSVAITVARATGDPEWQAVAPFVTALVDTNFGTRLPGRVLCSCGEGLQPGTPVRMVTVPTQTGHAVYAFEHDCRAGRS